MMQRQRIRIGLTRPLLLPSRGFPAARALHNSYGARPSFRVEPPPGDQLRRSTLARTLLLPFRILGPTNFRRAYRNNPIHLICSVIAVITMIGFALYVPVAQKNAFEHRFGVFPESIAAELRTALYYGSHANDDTKNQTRALRSYRRALELCTEHGLDPLSDQVLGIKLRVAQWMEEIMQHEGAASTLEGVLGECLRGMVEAEKEARGDGGGKEGGGTLRGIIEAGKERGNGDNGKEGGKGKEEEEGEESVENLWHRRRRLLHKAVQTGLRLAALYSDGHVLRPEKAQASAKWAVQTMLRETARRRLVGVREGEGAWMTADEIGASLEELGRQHEARSEFHLSIPLFFNAQWLCSDPCHRAVLMNNLAGSLAQHPGHAPFQLAPESLSPLLPEEGAAAAPEPAAAAAVPATRPEFLEAARRWASNAVAEAGAVTGERRTGECDEACAVALCTLGDVLAMMGRSDEARARFESARATSARVGFEEGVKAAEARLAVGGR